MSALEGFQARLLRRATLICSLAEELVPFSPKIRWQTHKQRKVNDKNAASGNHARMLRCVSYPLNPPAKKGSAPVIAKVSQ